MTDGTPKKKSSTKAKATAPKKVATAKAVKKPAEKKPTKKKPVNQGDLLDALDIGRRLENARKAKKMTLKQASEETQIRAETLQALEQNRFEELPEIVYVRGFIKIYAQVLELDANDLLADLGRYLKTEETETLILPSPVEEGTLPSFKVIALSLLVVVLMGAVWTVVDRPKLEVIGEEAPVPDTAQYQAMPKELKDAVQETAAPATAFERPINLEPQILAEVKEPEVAPTENEVESFPTAEDAPQTAPSTKSRVYLYALQDVWVSVYKEEADLPVFAKVLKAGKGYAVPDMADLVLDAGLPPALVVYVDGKRMGVSGVIDRRIRGLSLDPAYLTETYYPNGIYQQVNIKLASPSKYPLAPALQKPGQNDSKNDGKTEEDSARKVQNAIGEVPQVVIQEEQVPPALPTP